MENTKHCYSKLAPVLNAHCVKGTGKLACQTANLVLNPDGTGPPGLFSWTSPISPKWQEVVVNSKTGVIFNGR